MLKKSVFSNLKILLILALPILVVSCASSSEVVTADANRVAITMSDTDDIAEAMEIASKKAQKECAKYEKTAVLDHTEKTGADSEAGLAYFICE